LDPDELDWKELKLIQKWYKNDTKWTNTKWTMNNEQWLVLKMIGWSDKVKSTEKLR